MTVWHAKTVDDVIDEIDTNENGLADEEAERRLREYGWNEIREARKVSPFEIFLHQFRDVLIYLLVLAAGFSMAVGFLPGSSARVTDAVLILLIVIANGVFGFVQDYRAEKAMEALRELATPDTRILRNGRKLTVDARELVPGDIILVDQGDRIPADGRLIEAVNLETMEASLTGESVSVRKDVDPVDQEAPLAERSDMVFMNTDAVKGRGKAVVIATGMKTEVGTIAEQVQEAEDQETSFQNEVDELGRHIGYGALGLIVIVVIVQFLFTSVNWITIVLVAITLAVAAVPEGLPAVVTLTLAMGSKRMLRQRALVRRLPVVESLGSVDVIITDKTGTLTENQMTVKKLYFSGRLYELTGEGTEREGEFRRNGEQVDPEELKPLLKCGAVANDAEIPSGSDGADYYGDPTDIALLVSAAKGGIDSTGGRIREVPFSSERRRMTAISEDDPSVAFMKGAPEVILERCNRVLRDGEVQNLTDSARDELLEKNQELAEEAFRVLAMAHKEVESADVSEEELESDMIFTGLQAMIDPPRAEVTEAVQDCRDAGIRVVMVTGDNLATARAIGEQIGFRSDDAITGTEMEDLGDGELGKIVEKTEVFARVSPQHKVRILKALSKSDHRVAMTGDGVNDAPALRNADVGIAMGERGTDVAQEAADMVLLDDNFVTIRNAIAEGRGIFENIRKFVNFLLSANAGEILVVFFGVILGSMLFPETLSAHSEALILTPVMLLWINLVTDGLPALALGVDPKTKGIMQRPPRPPGEPVLDRPIFVSISVIGVGIAIAGLGLFFYSLRVDGNLVQAQTLLFTFVVIAEMGVVQLIRSRYQQGVFSNGWLVAAVASSVGLQALVLYTPLQGVFDVAPITLQGWLATLIAMVVFVAVYLISLALYRRLSRR